MGKRGNDNAQLTKEEYDLLTSRGDSGDDGLKQGFTKASDEELAKRRIIRRSKKPQPSPSSVPNFGAGSAAPATGGGLFANVNLTASSSAGLSAKPNFAMPSAPAATNPFGGISLTSTPSKPATSSSNGSTAGGAPSTARAKLVQEFKKQIANMPLRSDPILAIKRFKSTYASLLAQEEEKKPTGGATKPPSATPAAPAPVASTGTTKTTPSLFTPSSAPAPFSFGGSTAQSPVAASTTTFKFGNSIAKASGAQGPAPSSSGFSFVPAPAVAAPVPGANIKVALSPVPAAGETAETEGGAQPGEETTELASADTDWDTLLVTNVKIYHFRNEGKAKKFASGKLKIQQSQKEPNERRMVLRDAAGKVLFNVGIFNTMTFKKIIPAAAKGRAQTQGSVLFTGTRDEYGPENLQLVCKLEDHDSLHKKLGELSS